MTAIRRVALVALALPAALAGCGKKGQPLPPEPRGPFPAEQVDVRQLGDEVIVNFTVPRPRGPRPSQQPQRAELLRLAWAEGIRPPQDPAIFRRRAIAVDVREGPELEPGQRVEMSDPAALAPGEGDLTGWTLRYGVRVRDARGRPSALAASRDLVPVEPPPPPAAPRAEATADGVRLRWTAPPGVEEPRFNVYRQRLGRPLPEQPLNGSPLQVAEFLDAGVETGARYAYEIRTVVAAGRPFRESDPAGPVEVLAEDRFAPAPPEGLVGVQEGQAVRLFWNPNREPDLGGYRVYRSRDWGEWVRVGPETVQQALFLDRQVATGEHLRYRVTALDRVVPANESDPSEEVEIDVVADPSAGGRERP